jgi:hypothetical protein
MKHFIIIFLTRTVTTSVQPFSAFWKQRSFEVRHNTDTLFYFIFILIQFSLSALRADTLYCLFVIPILVAFITVFF